MEGEKACFRELQEDIGAIKAFAGAASELLLSIFSSNWSME